jgi:hypothetical protein
MCLYAFSPPEYDEVVFVIMSTYMSICTCGCVPCYRLNGWTVLYSCSVFKSLDIIGQCLVNVNISTPKIGVLQMDLKAQNRRFS